MTGSVQTNYNSIPQTPLKKVKPNVGVINAPQGHYKPVLYSHAQASREFVQLNKELNAKMKTIKKPTKKTPTSVYIFTGIGALAIAFPFLRKLIKK